MIKKIVWPAIIFSLSSLCACSHLRSVYTTPSQENTCINLQRQQLFLNKNLNHSSAFQEQTDRMQLEKTYREQGCYSTIQRSNLPTGKQQQPDETQDKQ